VVLDPPRSAGRPCRRRAVARTSSRAVVDAPIVGATKPHHPADTAAAQDLQLTDDEVAALAEHYTARQPTYFN
jgi:aryl-alcohol dehydrogenase-like predicted oxidoreductase